MIPWADPPDREPGLIVVGEVSLLFGGELVGATKDLGSEEGRQRLTVAFDQGARFTPKPPNYHIPSVTFAAPPSTSLHDLARFASAMGSPFLDVVGYAILPPWVPNTPGALAVVRTHLSELGYPTSDLTRTGDGWIIAAPGGPITLPDDNPAAGRLAALFPGDLPLAVTLTEGRPSVGELARFVGELWDAGLGLNIALPPRFWDPRAAEQCEVINTVRGSSPEDLLARADAARHLTSWFTLPGMTCRLGSLPESRELWSCESAQSSHHLADFEAHRAFGHLRQCVEKGGIGEVLPRPWGTFSLNRWVVRVSAAHTAAAVAEGAHTWRVWATPR